MIDQVTYLIEDLKIDEANELIYLENDKLKCCKRYIRCWELIKASGCLPEQKSKAWLDQRMNCLTASIIHVCMYKSFKYGNVSEVILEKITRVQKFTGNEATAWGTKYEDLAVLLYETKHNVKIYDAGMIQHKDYDFLGASCDGFIPIKKGNDYIDGEIIEIKCPFRRRPNGKVPPWYYDQMQLQLEVTGMKVCRFLDCRITEHEYLVGSTNGFVLKDGSFKFYRLDGKVVGELVDEFDVCFSIPNYYITTVHKEKNWMKKNIDTLTRVWELINEGRKAYACGNFKDWEKDLQSKVDSIYS